MGKLNIYIRGNKSTYFYKNKEEKRGFIEEKNIKDFVEKSKVKNINFIFSKPDVIFRKLSFDFSDIKKIKMVLPSEIESTLPEKIENYLFDYKFIRQNKKTSVNVIGVKKDFYNKFISYRKHKKKIYFFLDTEILFSLLKDKIKETNYIEVYIDSFYILINVIENKNISSCLSYIFENGNSDQIISIVNKILLEKNYPVYITGEEKEIENFKNKTKIKLIKIPFLKENFQPFFFSEIINKNIKFTPLKLTPPSIKIISPVPYVISFLMLILFLFPSLISYRHFKEKQQILNEIETKMISEFRKTFPDVKKIVDPVVQAKEKLNQTEETSISIQYPSILEMLVQITNIFPEDVNVEINRLSFSNSVLTISGFIDNLKNLEKVKEKINKSTYFSNLQIGSISFDRNHRVNFNFTVKVKKWKKD